MMRFSAILVTIFLFGAPVLAQSDQDAARAAFKKAREHFAAGEYTIAVSELKRAYKMKPHPALLRYLAQTYYKMNKAGLALKYFKKYLNDAPEAPDKSEVAAKIRELEMVIKAGQEEPEPAPPKTAPPKPAKKEPKSKAHTAPTGEDDEVPDAIAGRKQGTGTSTQSGIDGETDEPSAAMTYLKWISLGVGILGVSAGIATAVMSSSKATELEDSVKAENPTMDKPTRTYQQSDHEVLVQHKNLKTGSIISFAVGGAAIAASVVFFILDRPNKDAGTKTSGVPRTLVAPVFGPNYCGLAGRVAF